jgi:hypothetical protein
LEALRAASTHLVEERVEETKRLSGLLDGNIVEESDDTSDDRRRGRCTTNRLNASTIDDEDVGTESSDVREPTTLSVVVTGRWELDSRLEVVGDSLSLV